MRAIEEKPKTLTIRLNKKKSNMEPTISQNTDEFKYMTHTIIFFFFFLRSFSRENNESALVKLVKK